MIVKGHSFIGVMVSFSLIFGGNTTELREHNHLVKGCYMMLNRVVFQCSLPQKTLMNSET